MKRPPRTWRSGPLPKRLDMPALIRDYTAGMGFILLRKKYHATTTRLRRELIAAGVRIRTNGESQRLRAKELNIPAFIRDYRDMSLEALGKKYHVSIHRARRVLLAAGIVLRPANNPPGFGGREHSLTTRMKISAAQRAMIEPSDSEKRQAGHCPITGLSEQRWARWQRRKAKYTCQATGRRGIKLAVHHLYGVATHPELRWDESNIVVVGNDLHLAFHTEFMGGWMKPVTPRDWHSFLKGWEELRA
jgi:hypothetical protein